MCAYGSVDPVNPYLPRVVDLELDDLLGELPALAVDGAKGVGKTETASRLADLVIELDDPARLELLRADMSWLDSVQGTVLVDEWQRHPPIWDFVRREVDSGAKAGRFLLTGSASPADAGVHSGAGRIVRLRMRPMALAERDLICPTVSLGTFLGGGTNRPKVAGESPLGLADYVEEILASGFPAIRVTTGRARRALLTGYIERVVDRDFLELGHQVRRPETLRAWLAAYAAATASTTSYNALLDAATAGQVDKPAKTTTIAYRDTLTRLWLLDPVPGWAPGYGHLGRLAQGPKHHLADPALAATLLGVDADKLITGDHAEWPVPRDGSLLGALFESLVALSIRVYAQAHEATVSHLRLHDGRHEVDFIVERADGAVVAFEVKLGAAVGGDDVKHLLWLRDQLGERLLDAVVISTGPTAYRRPDGIAVVPAALLGV
jgi:predicted AAA+ superfamily ATPase